MDERRQPRACRDLRGRLYCREPGRTEQAPSDYENKFEVHPMSHSVSHSGMQGGRQTNAPRKCLQQGVDSTAAESELVDILTQWPVIVRRSVAMSAERCARRPLTPYEPWSGIYSATQAWDGIR